jgi:hypothetical protein
MDMTKRNYDTFSVPAGWADSRETHDAVATAIHAIADSSRSPETIAVPADAIL